MSLETANMSLWKTILATLLYVIHCIYRSYIIFFFSNNRKDFCGILSWIIYARLFIFIQKVSCVYWIISHFYDNYIIYVVRDSQIVSIVRWSSMTTSLHFLCKWIISVIILIHTQAFTKNQRKAIIKSFNAIY